MYPYTLSSEALALYEYSFLVPVFNIKEETACFGMSTKSVMSYLREIIQGCCVYFNSLDVSWQQIIKFMKG